jgi:hypothetical protein
LAYVFLSLLGGIAAIASDAMDDADLGAVAFVVCATSLPLIPLSLPYATTGDPQASDWVGFGFEVGDYLASMGFAIWALAAEDSTAAGKSSTLLMAWYSLLGLAASCIIFSTDKNPGTWDNVSFAATLLSWIDGVVNPLKFIAEVKPVILFFDLALPVTSGIMTCIDYVDSNP